MTTTPPTVPQRPGVSVRLLRVRARWFVGTILLVVLGAAIVSWTQPRTYEATAQVVVLAEVEPGDTATPPTPAMGTEKGLVTTDVVARTAARRLGVPVGRILDAASVTVPPQTQILAITCSADDPRLAAGCAQNLGEAYVQYKDTQPIMTTPERARVVTPAVVPTSPTLPNVPLNLLAGLLVGLVAGLAVAVLWDRLDPRRGGPEELERQGLPVLGVVPSSGDGAGGRRAYDALGARLRAVTADDPDGPDGPAESRPAPIVVLTPIDDREVPLRAIGTELAAALAADGDHVVLVRTDAIDTDAGDDTTPGPALLDVLGAPDVAAALDRALVEDGTGQPTVLSRGGPADARIPRRAWARAAGLLTDRCDVVLVLADPLRSSADALAVAGEASAVVALVGPAGTTRAAVDALRDEGARLGLSLVGCVVATAPPPTFRTSDTQTAQPADRGDTVPESAVDETVNDETADVAPGCVDGEPLDRRPGESAPRQHATGTDEPVEGRSMGRNGVLPRRT